MHWQRKTIDKQKREEAISINSSKAVGLILLSSIIVEKKYASPYFRALYYLLC